MVSDVAIDLATTGQKRGFERQIVDSEVHYELLKVEGYSAKKGRGGMIVVGPKSVKGSDSQGGKA